MSEWTMIHETQIFIEKPIRDVVRDAHFDQKPIVVREGNEIAFLFGGMHPDEAVFGLSADMDAPQGPFWTQLLHKHPKDLVALARVLTTLNIKRDQITPATDWDGEPLFDVDALKREMLVVVENPSAARTSKSTVGTRRPQKVPIATFRGKAIGGFASVRAAAKPAAKKVVAKPAAKKAAAKPAAKKVAAKPAAKKVAAQKAAATKLAATKTRQA